MIDWIIGFASGVLFSPIFLAVVFIAAMLSETNERIGWSAFLGTLTVVSLWGVFGLSTLTGLGWYTLAAIFVIGGIVHALWRWFRSTAKATERFNSVMASNGLIDANDVHGSHSVSQRNRAIGDYKDETNFRENLDKITYWVLAWPISGAAHFLGDIVLLVKNAVVTFFSGIFDRISERARGKAVINVADYDT